MGASDLQIVVLGMNHRTAPLELRERIAFLPEELEGALARLRETDVTPEAVLLSTCNRTEFYTVTPDPERALATQRELVRGAKQFELTEERTYVHRQEECVAHLFRVAAGVDSMVVGETGILGQVRTAHEAAMRCQASGTVLHRLFEHALRVGKRSRAETRIGEGAVSLPKAGVQLAGKIFGDLRGHPALVVGSGRTGQLTAQLLHEAGVSDFVFANRTLARAEALAARYGGRAVGLQAIGVELRRADIVVSAVDAPEPILGRDEAMRGLDGRRRGHVLFVDLGVPRNLEPTIDKLDDVFLYAVDDLQELVNLSVERRRAEIPKVEEIVGEERRRFFEWMSTLETAPVLVALRDQADRVRRHALARAGRGLSERERELLEKFSVGLTKKLMHSPTVSVRELDASTHEGLSRLLWTRILFDLDETERNGREDDG